MSPRVFAYELAQRAPGTERMRSLVAQPIAKIRHYVPVELVPSLEGASQALPEGQERASALEALQAAGVARARWERGETGDRREQEAVRAATFRVAHAAREHGLDEVNRTLLAAAVEIGTT